MPDLEICFQNRGRPKHVYLMDMNELYLVAVRLRGWEFMAEASHINAQKAVRGLAADLQDFNEEGQRSSAAQLMQQGAAAVAVAAIEDARQAATGERMELELAERRFDLKRKSEDWDQSLRERQMTLPLGIQKQKLDMACNWMACTEQINPDWRADPRLQRQAQDLLCNAFLIEPRLATTQGAAAAERAAAERAAAERAAAARLGSVSLGRREMLGSLRLRLEMLSPDAVAEASAGAPGAGAAAEASAGAPGVNRNNIWRGRHCVHSRRPYRCKLCKS